MNMKYLIWQGQELLFDTERVLNYSCRDFRN